MPFRIFYLDDEPDLLEIFVDTFGEEGIEISTFTKPAEALAAIRANPPQLLFLDFRLPGTTGPDVAAAVDPSIPKVLITGDMDVAHDAKFVAVLEKPMKLKTVRALIETYRKPTAA